jgi:hypothetical protein
MDKHIAKMIECPVAQWGDILQEKSKTDEKLDKLIIEATEITTLSAMIAAYITKRKELRPRKMYEVPHVTATKTALAYGKLAKKLFANPIGDEVSL